MRSIVCEGLWFLERWEAPEPDRPPSGTGRPSISLSAAVAGLVSDAGSILLVVRFSLFAVSVAAVLWFGNRFYRMLSTRIATNEN